MLHISSLFIGAYTRLIAALHASSFNNGFDCGLAVNCLVALVFVAALSIFWKRMNIQVKKEGITAIELALGLALVVGIPASLHRVLSWTAVTIATSSAADTM